MGQLLLRAGLAKPVIHGENRGQAISTGRSARPLALDNPMQLWLRAIPAMMGVFGFTLGTLHFFFPPLLDCRNAIPTSSAPLESFQLGPLRCRTQRSDVHGLTWVMNHAASYGLVSLGLFTIGTDSASLIYPQTRSA